MQQLSPVLYDGIYREGSLSFKIYPESISTNCPIEFQNPERSAATDDDSSTKAGLKDINLPNEYRKQSFSIVSYQTRWRILDLDRGCGYYAGHY